MRTLLAASTFVVAASACSSPNPGSRVERYTLRFEALVAGAPAECDRSYEGLGTGKVRAKIADLRLYVHDVRLVRQGGQEVPFELDDDGKWQRQGLALLDFEDGRGSCATGSPETHPTLEGRAPDHDDYVGIAFKVGVPAASNHLDAATAPPPLNSQGLWWSWRGGFKYMRTDLVLDDGAPFYFHLGATDCKGTVTAVETNVTCAAGNVANITLRGKDPTKSTVVFDLADLVAERDLAQKPDMKTDNVPGCMAFPGDPECPSMMGKLGLAFGSSAAGEATLFRWKP
jgi:uncharacterized repeat protein (TIGR04052 family)